MPPPELLAFAAALQYASAFTLVKLGSVHGDMRLGFLGSLATGTLVIAVAAVLVVDSWSVPPASLTLYALGGLLGPGVGRALGMRAVRDVGSSVSVPVQSSANPLIATAAAVVLFGETVGPARALGLGLIVTGIWSCVRGGSANTPEIVGAHGLRPPGQRGYRALALPLAAGAAYAGVSILHKQALVFHDEPVLGSLVATFTALLAWTAVSTTVPALRPQARITPGFGWFALSGMLMAGAQISLLLALQAGDLSLVAPIVSSQPVIAIVLAAVALRDVERLRLGTVVGSVTVLAGLVALSVF